MKNVLIYANTYMQVINAIQIKRKLYPIDNVDLIISDHSVGARQVALNLKDENRLFRRVKFVSTHFFEFEQGLFADIADVLFVSSIGHKKYKSLCWDDNMRYDILFYYNTDIMLYPIFDAIHKAPSFICIRFEEGITSYQSMLTKGISPRMKLTDRLRRILGKKLIYDTEKGLCCYYTQILRQMAMENKSIKPNFYKDKNKIYEKDLVAIPFLSRSDKNLLLILNRVFDYHTSQENYSQRYIYFATSSDIDGHGLGEVELVLKIAELVGKENLLVKMHPRDPRNVYEERGIVVSRESKIPWEVVQLNHDFSKHVFLSLSSGSVMCATAMLGDSVLTWYLWDCVERSNKWLERNKKNVHDALCALWENDTCKNIHVAKRLEDIIIDAQ